MNEHFLRDHIKSLALDLLMVGGYRLHVLPHSYQLYSPIKVYELETVLAHLCLPAHATVLDLCCGTGIQTQILARYASKVVGVDSDCKKIRDACWHLRYSRFRNSVSFTVGVAEELPLPDESMDAITCLCAIEHLANPSEALREMVRVLRPDGRLCITADSLANVKNCEIIDEHQQVYKVHNYFDAKTLSRLLQETGFHIDVAFPMLCSAKAVEEMIRCIKDPSPCGPIRTRRLLSTFRRSDVDVRGHKDGLFVFASARRL